MTDEPPMCSTHSFSNTARPMHHHPCHTVFATLPNLTVTGYKPFIRIYGDMAINDGYYTVHFDGPEGVRTRG